MRSPTARHQVIIHDLRPESPQAEPQSMRSVVSRLSAAQKSAKGAPGYSRYVNRRIGRLLAAVSYRLGLSPTQVTCVSAAFTFAAVALLVTVRPTVLVGVLVTVLLLTGYAFDSADGQLARLTHRSSSAGEWLDHMVDATKIASMHLAVLLSLHRFGHLAGEGYLLVPLGFSVVTTVLFFGMTLNDLLRRAAGPAIPPPPAGSASAARSLALLPTDFGVVCLVFLLLGVRQAFLWGYALLFAAHVAFLLLAAPKWYRSMRSLGAGLGA